MNRRYRPLFESDNEKQQPEPVINRTAMQTRLFWLCLLWVAATPAALAQAVSTRIEVRNTSSTPWQDRVVAIPWDSVLKRWPGAADTSRLVLYAASAPGRQLLYQLETKGTGRIANLLVQLSLGAGSASTLVMTAGKKQAFAPRTFCRYVPERYEDFAWENDRIAFRAYGKALEATKENAWGTDVWSKRTAALIINKWYLENDYHKDHGEGLDYYKVGFTLGAGNMALLQADTLCYFANYDRYEVLDNGPLRSSFRLHHPPLALAGGTVALTREISIDAGSQLYRVTARLATTGTPALRVVAGIRKNVGADVVWQDHLRGIMGYWNPEEAPNGSIGVGVLATQGAPVLRIAQGHLLAELPAGADGLLQYYTGAAWNKAGLLTDSDAWFAYLRQFRQMMMTNPTIKFR